MMNVLMTVVILYIILTASSVTGVVFKLGNEEFIPTDGSGRLLINDIDMNVRIEESDAGLTIVNDHEKALLCHSTNTTIELRTLPHTSYWYLDPEVNTTTRTGSLIIENENDRGWTRVIGRISLVENGALYRAAFLKRETENAMEGKFTCHIDNDSHNDKYVLILYPILSVLVSVSVDFESPYQYRIECTSTGGRALNMSITGPHGEVLPLHSIQEVGTQRWLGNDSYTGVGTVDYVDSGEYSCEASNGVSSANGSYIIRVTKGPSNVRLKRISPTEVRVEWSHPPGGVTVAGYIVLYKDGNVTMNMTVPASNTNVVISVLPLKYSISVIAILNETQYLLGRSPWKTISIWSPEEVKWKSLGSDSVRVSWEAVEYADYYTVSFSQTVGDDQEGLCKNESHFASVTVPATDRTADVIIPVGDEVEIDNTSVLRAFTTYSVKIVPFGTVWGESVGSKPINITTPSKKPTIAPTNLTLVNTTSTTIKVKWRSDLSPCRLVNRPITGFRIQYKVKNESEKALITTGITTNATLTGLHPLTNYTIRVPGVNSAGIGPYCDSIMAMTNKTSSSGGPGDNISGTSIGGIIAGIITMFLVSLVCVLLAAFALRKFSRREKKRTSIERLAIHVESTDGPNIVRFPSEFVQVNERERVVFDVRVEGNPRPQLTWYYDDREVVGTDSIDLGLDGSLTLPCSEPSHTGVYQLVAVNSIGQTEKEVELIVRKDKQPIPKNAGENISIPPVPVAGFIEYVTNCRAYGDELLKEQFTVLDVDPELPTTIGTDPDVELLNRFANITVYDTNRIVLTPIEGQLDWCQRDYINACYIDGYKIRKMFIATQGPLAETVVDFWRLVWQERPATIVMLTDLKEEDTVKCHKYWPDSETQLFGPFKVTITDQQRFTDYTSRSFFLKLENGGSQNFQVSQLQYTAWPASGVPSEATSFLAFHRRVKKQHKFPKGPILVHCSGGVGRTGTLITIDRVLDQMLDEKIVDIAGNIRNLRNQRMKMVQLQGQYIFIHDIIVEDLMFGDTEIDVVNFRAALLKLSQPDAHNNTTGYEKQFKALERIESHGQSNADSHKKHRNSVFLESLDGCSTELENEVVYVDGYKQKKMFIITENPAHSTTGDFWKMVYETKCGVIVNLNSSEEIENDVCYKYWPDTGTMNDGGYLIDSVRVKEHNGFVIRSLSITSDKTENSHAVCQIHVTCWNPDGECTNLYVIVHTIMEMVKYQRRSGGHPVVVHCSDTVGRSGMFCAIATTIERCKTEGVVDVFQVVKALRVQKPGAVTNVVCFDINTNVSLVFLP